MRICRPGNPANWISAFLSGRRGLVGLAALARVVAPLAPDGAALLLGLSGLAWVGAFGLFVMLYGPLLTGLERQ